MAIPAVPRFNDQSRGDQLTDGADNGARTKLQEMHLRYSPDPDSTGWFRDCTDQEQHCRRAFAGMSSHKTQDLDHHQHVENGLTAMDGLPVGRARQTHLKRSAMECCCCRTQAGRKKQAVRANYVSKISRPTPAGKYSAARNQMRTAKAQPRCRRGAPEDRLRSRNFSISNSR